MSGILYIVATPIGNLNDITIRAIEVLKQSDYILAESSARTSKLLHEYDIKKKIVTFNKDNEKRKRSSILRDLSAGSVLALVSDAGTPSISDPGFELVKSFNEDYRIIPIPGASSLTCALSISKIPINNFIFLGFLPKKISERKSQLIKIKNTSLPAVVFESKHRLNSVLAEILNILGPDTDIGIMRELTKIHEDIFFNKIEEIMKKLEKETLNGEITMIINHKQEKPLELDSFKNKIIELSKRYSTKEVVNIIKLFSDVDRKELYKYVLSIRHEG